MFKKLQRLLVALFATFPVLQPDAALAWDKFIEAGTAPVSARERAWLATSLAAIKSRQKEKDSGSDARVFTHDFLQMKAPRVSSVINLAEKGNVQHRCVAGVVSQVLSADLVRYFEFGWFTFNGKAMMSISTDSFGRSNGRCPPYERMTPFPELTRSLGSP